MRRLGAFFGLNYIIFLWGGGGGGVTTKMAKIQIFFGVLGIPNIFWRQTVDAGPNPTYEEKVRLPPPPPPPLTHTHTHSPWVTVYDEKLLAK